MLTKEDAKQRLHQYGPEVLTNAELLSMILCKGKKNVTPQHAADD